VGPVQTVVPTYARERHAIREVERPVTSSGLGVVRACLPDLLADEA